MIALPLIEPLHHAPADLTPAQRRGLRYQARVGKWLHANWSHLYEITEGPWLQGPHGPCQPDFVLARRTAAEDRGAHLIVVETKLTQCDCSAQLARYKAALAPLGPAALVQIARRVTAPPTVRDLSNPCDGTMLLYL